MVDFNKYLDTADESMHCVDKFTRERPEHMITKMYEEILTLVPEKKGEIVWDIGCAGGYYSTRLRDKGKVVQAVSINQKDLDILKGLGIPGLLSDMHELKAFPECVNGIFCSHTLEHSPAPHIALSEFYRVLIPGGWLLIVMPEAAGRVVGGWRRSEDFGDHFFFPTAEVLIQMLRKVGFNFKAPNCWYSEIPLHSPNDSVSDLYRNMIWFCRK